MKYEVYKSVGEVTRITEYEGTPQEIALLIALLDKEESEIPGTKLEVTPEQEHAFLLNRIKGSVNENLRHFMNSDAPSLAPLNAFEPEDFLALLRGFYVVKKEGESNG
ncbi:hypothetical protein [Bacillus badius]|uniref:Phage protein n=1 Tax=Bacillus badius TaxID=1455 RepID=A0ABR5AP48_BACBA|nr:hypothetical protein [Bacillus badius]KIL72707.1 hypothetical protein SD77_3442 [Bacillus badius]MED4715446.1 hypothetical protein [Bacillus badius]